MVHATERAAFLAALDSELEADPDAIVVIRIDLDRFWRIRETFGADTADAVHRDVVDRIRELIPSDSAFLEYAEDAFAGLLRVPNANPDELQDLAMRVVRSISAPIMVVNRPPIAVGSNVGLAAAAHFPRADAMRLLAGAEVALDRVNVLGSRRAAVFRPHADENPTLISRGFEDMLNAIGADQFQPWFQPVVSLPDRRIVGSEVLVRWMHPTYGPMAPADFRAEAESSGLIREIDAAVWTRASEVLAELPKDLQLSVSLNTSPADLAFPDLITTVSDCVERLRLDPRRIVFEVSESTLSHNPHRTRRQLQAMKGLGVRIAIDGFGSGPMALDQLHTGLFDVLKLDRSLVAPDGRDAGYPDEFLSGVVTVAHSFGMKVVASGIETQAQLQRAQDAGCDRAQGYLFSHVHPAADFVELARTTSTL